MTALKTIAWMIIELYLCLCCRLGKAIAIGTQESKLLLYDLKGNEIDRVEAAPWSETFSPDGKIIAIANADSTVTLWNWQNKSVTKLEGHQGEVLDVDFSSDGKYIVSSSSDRIVRFGYCDRLKSSSNHQQVNINNV